MRLAAALASLLGFAGAAAAAGPAWHGGLCAAGGGYWRSRIALTFRSEDGRPAEGTPVAAPLRGETALRALIGQRVGSLRVCDELGRELLYAVLDDQGQRVTEGLIPAAGRLVVPVELPAGGEANLYVYLDNPAAWPVPEFLEAAGRTAASGVELVGAGPLERRVLKRLGADAPWVAPPRAAGAAAWDGRAMIRVRNVEDQPLERALVAVDLRRLAAHLRGRLAPDRVRVTFQGQTVPHVLSQQQLLFEAAVPARSECVYYAYFSREARGVGEPKDVRELVHSAANLVNNPSFELGETTPEGWEATGASSDSQWAKATLDRTAAPGLGARSARLEVAPGAPSAWRGWRQAVPVEPGKTYLFSAWVKCQDIAGEPLRVHGHRRTADGKLSATNPLVSIGPGVEGGADWTRWSGVFTMPPDTEVFEVHLTMNTPGVVWHDGVVVAQVAPGELVELQAPPDADGRPALLLWQVPAVEKVFRDTIPPRRIRPARIEAARNEWESLQLAARGLGRGGAVRVRVQAPVGPKGAKLDQFDVAVCGFVPVDYPTSYYRYEGPLWRRKVPRQPPSCDGWAGWWPDPLLPRDQLRLEPDRTEAVWITFRIGKETPPGDYRGRVALVDATDGRVLAETPLTVRVWDFTLPDRPQLAAIYDVRFGPGRSVWGEPFDEAYPKIVEFLARRRLSPDRVRPEPALRLRDGRVEADFTEFDRQAAWYFDQLGLPYSYTPRLFYLFGWGHPPRSVGGERPYPGDPPYEGADRSQLRPEYKQAYQALLRAFWSHVRERGWSGRFVLYISDEPFYRHPHIRRQMQALCDMIHEVDRRIPIYSSTWVYVADWVDCLDIWGVGHQGRIAAERMRELRRRGARLWFTTDGQMCLDTPYCAVERLLPYYCFVHDVEAYEFWGVSWLTRNPYRYGWHAFIHQSNEPGRSFWVRYPNGDGYLIYPGRPIGYDGLVSTVRLEQAREGVEDHAYLCLLRERLAAAEARGQAGPALAEARRVLAEVAQLAAIPNAGGRYATRILPDPERLYELRRRLAAAVTGLASQGR